VYVSCPFFALYLLFFVVCAWTMEHGGCHVRRHRRAIELCCLLPLAWRPGSFSVQSQKTFPKRLFAFFNAFYNAFSSRKSQQIPLTFCLSFL
jgi:hypothetical protein